MSDKEVRLIQFLNIKTDSMNNANNQLAEALKKTNSSDMPYVNGYAAAIVDIKTILLKLLKGDEIIIDDNV